MLVVLANHHIPGPGEDVSGARPSKAKGWYWRALLVNFVQLELLWQPQGFGFACFTSRFSICLPGTCLSRKASSGGSLEHFSFIGGMCCGTRMDSGWYSIKSSFAVANRDRDIFLQAPIEVLSDAILSALVMYPLLGSSMMGAFWYNFFAATGEYFITQICEHRAG